MRLASLPIEAREAFYAEHTEEQLSRLRYDYRFLARGEQLPPAGSWRYWLVQAGRGFGKSWVGAQWSHEQAERYPNLPGLLAARSAGDARETMVEGVSGILATAKPWFRPRYEPSKRKLTWPNGAWALVLGADEPEIFRGKNSAWAWVDELAAWSYSDSWDQLLLGLRIGEDPRCVITTTPRPTSLIISLVKDPNTVVTRGSTDDNRVNLAPAFYEHIISKYRGTTIGRQELEGELLADIPGALWKRAQIERDRVLKVPDLRRIVVAIDPAATSGEKADDTGIMVAGLGADGHGYALSDLTCHKTPGGWALVAVGAYDSWKADLIVGESNNGGEMVGLTLETVRPNVPYKLVHASRGKRTRAEPISALCEQGRIHHVGVLRDLEDEQCTWVPGVTAESPNRVDAFVWAMTELVETGLPAAIAPNPDVGYVGNQWSM